MACRICGYNGTERIANCCPRCHSRFFEDYGKRVEDSFPKPQKKVRKIIPTQTCQRQIGIYMMRWEEDSKLLDELKILEEQEKDEFQLQGVTDDDYIEPETEEFGDVPELGDC